MWTTTLRIGCLIPILLLVTTHINGQMRNPIDDSSYIFHETSSSTLNTTIDALPNLKAETMSNNDLDSVSDKYNDFSTESTEETSVPMTTTNEISTNVETSMELTTPSTPETCAIAQSNGFIVKNRTSNAFTVVVTYNCSLISLPQLSDYQAWGICHISRDTSPLNVTVTCDSTQKNAGRNVTFGLQGDKDNQIIVNQTITITLLPLSLSTSTNISMTIHPNLTASFFILDCKSIVEPDYLVFLCDSNTTSVGDCLKENCMCTCSDLLPGKNYTVSLVRLNMTLEGFSPDSENVVNKESISVFYHTELDPVKNLNCSNSLSETGTGILKFNCPRGFYDKIQFNCSTQDRKCSNGSEFEMNDIDSCPLNGSISISKLIEGVTYNCTATTMKDRFEDAPIESCILKRDLRPVTYDSSMFLNKSVIDINVSYQSDYDQINATCSRNISQGDPCVNYQTSNKNCSTSLTITGALGCNYQCSFTTIKQNYISASSNNISWSLAPPTPVLTLKERGSRWVFISWNISEIAYIRSFDVCENTSCESLVNATASSDRKTFSYNYTKSLLPFRGYTLYVQLNSNFKQISEKLFFNTTEEAPEGPEQSVVDEKINPLGDGPGTTSEQYLINIDTTLFSNEYGIVQSFSIYVRQNQTNNDTSDINRNQTYSDAQRDQSLDYFALEIPISLSTERVSNANGYNISIIIGNQTGCDNAPQEPQPCNGPLRPSTTYKVIVLGCTSVGCTPVLSKAFTTSKLPSKPKRSLGWVAIFPVLAVLAIVSGLAFWKRNEIKQMIGKQAKKKSEETSIPTPVTYSAPKKRPKPLSQYVDRTKEGEKAMRNEYQELDRDAPQYSQSDNDPQYSTYNRYGNIPARGTWEGTAVRLDGAHRTYDYINANEIKGFYSDKQYLAAQGPLKGTSEDFWDMIIQYRVLKVVMLTRTEERNPHNPSQTTIKCHRYFPWDKGDSLTFGQIDVEVLGIEKQMNGELEIRHILIKDETTEHRIFHFYFTGWPDFSVVDQKKLVALIETVNNYRQDPSTSKIQSRESLLTPMVVHCSAGVGRTGTYIAVDIIMHLINQSKDDLSTMELDVMGIVFQLRQNRVKMVQTRDQYMLVNHCVEEYLQQINRLSDISSGISIYENIPPVSSSNLNRPKKKKTVTHSAVYLTMEKSISSTDRSDGSSIVLRSSIKEEERRRPRRSTHRKPSNKV